MASLRLGVLASHGGSGARAVAAAIGEGRLPAEICAVISNNSAAPALAWAAERGIPAAHISSVTHGPGADAAIRDRLTEAGAEWVLLSGYLKPVGPLTLGAFRGRVLNVHPSLLPSFGGRGMYGDRVHEAVLAAGVAESGATVHLVGSEYDHGPILGWRRVPVLAGDTVGDLRARVMAAEADLLVKTLGAVAALGARRGMG